MKEKILVKIESIGNPFYRIMEYNKKNNEIIQKPSKEILEMNTKKYKKGYLRKTDEELLSEYPQLRKFASKEFFPKKVEELVEIG